MNTNLLTNAERAAYILKSFEIDIQKGAGEGSKGGKVIGHTKSGKAIYEMHHAGHPDYADFTKEDHQDAYKVHDKEMRSAISPSAKDRHRNRKHTHKTAIEMGLHKKD